MFRGPTKYSEYIQDVPKSIDFILKRVNAVTVSDLQAVTQAGATTTLPINTGGITSDYFQLDTTATPTLVPGMFGWNNAYGTADLRLKGNNVTLQLGQETLARVVNKTGSDLLESEYKVVRVRIASEGGAQGQRLAVVLAQGLNDPDSATTLGIVTETIPNNQEGFITVFGNVNNINTTGSLQGETWADGDVLYLSPTIAGGLTKVKPVAPQHMVVMGYVVYAHAINGKIFVKVDNGYELDELHNVLITSPANNDLLQYNSAQQVWKNVAPSIAVPTPTLAQVTTAGNTTTNAITVGGLAAIGSTNTAGIVNITNNFSGTYPNAVNVLFPNISSSSVQAAGLFIGKALSVYNGWGVNYTHSADGSTSNRGSIAFYGTDNIINWFANGNVTINSTTNAGYKLDVNGTARINSSLYVTDPSFTGSGRFYQAGNATTIISGGPASENITFGPSNRIFINAGQTRFPGGSVQMASTLTLGNSGNATSTNMLLMQGSITAGSALGRGIGMDTALVAAANNDVLVGLDINPTFTNGAFTGVSNVALRVNSGFTYLGGTLRISATTANPTGAGGFFVFDGSEMTNFSYDYGSTTYRALAYNGSLVRFLTAGTERARFAVTTGNLLINTTTDAGYKLDVNGTARVNNTFTVTKSGSNNYFNFEPSATGVMPYVQAFYQGAVDSRLYFDSSFLKLRYAGSTLLYGLDCGNINASGNVLLSGTGDQKVHLFGSTNNFVQFSDAGATNIGVIGTADATTYIQVRTGNATNMSTGTLSAVFFNSGNVGINTTTDTGEKLQVNGSIKSSALTLNGPVLATGGVLSSIAGYTGLFTVPTNPPGMQTLDIQNGIIVNVL